MLALGRNMPSHICSSAHDALDGSNGYEFAQRLIHELPKIHIRPKSPCNHAPQVTLLPPYAPEVFPFRTAGNQQAPTNSAAPC